MRRRRRGKSEGVRRREPSSILLTAAVIQSRSGGLAHSRIFVHFLSVGKKTSEESLDEDRNETQSEKL